MIKPTVTAAEWRANDARRKWLESVLSEPLGRDLMGMLLDFASTPRTVPLDTAYTAGCVHGRREVYNLLVSLTAIPDKKKADVTAGYGREETK